MAQDTSEIKSKMISIVQEKGPCIPVHIAKETGLSILFASAFLSELLAEKRLKMSNMRVGNSPVYFIPEQEPLLENFSNYLKSKEKEAFILLKEKSFLKDSEQHPPIRVALRALKDFAIPFRRNDEIYWRYFTIPESELKTTKKEVLKKPEEIKKEEVFEVKEEKPKQIKKQIKKTKIIEKSEFVQDIINLLKSKEMNIIEELEIKKKEFLGTTKIKTILGNVDALVIAKDKKKITKNDIELALQKSNFHKKIALLITTGKVEKKSLDYLNDHKGIIKLLNVNN